MHLSHRPLVFRSLPFPTSQLLHGSKSISRGHAKVTIATNNAKKKKFERFFLPGLTLQCTRIADYYPLENDVNDKMDRFLFFYSKAKKNTFINSHNKINFNELKCYYKRVRLDPILRPHIPSTHIRTFVTLVG